jgi:ABC-2 type transport system ATP-binding protein
MDDVASLCRRVIVIDKGTLRYDGDLAGLVRSRSRDKRIALKLSAEPDRAALEKVGTVVELEPGRALLQVKHEDLREAVGFLLDLPAVTDLTVEDPPLEEIMRELFEAEKDAPRAAAPTKVEPMVDA